MFEELIKQLKQENMQQVARQLEAQAKASIRLSATRIDDENLPKAASRIGGRPDLAPRQSWPIHDGKPMRFLAQINLGELPRSADYGFLPGSGLLTFFYDEESEAWGFDPEDRGSWRVLFFCGDFDVIQRRSHPGNPDEDDPHFPCLAASFQLEKAYPSREAQEFSALNLNEADILRFDEIEGQVHESMDETPIHRMLGFADEVQGEMRLECQLVSQGLYCGDGSGYSDPRAKALEGGALDWELLLQLDTDDSCEMMWGDCGRLYFWIRREDLNNADFERTWMCLQCY